MGLFVSRRERRLWLWTAAVVVAIYSTLGLAGTLAEKLYDAGLLDAALFLLGMLLVGATVLIHGLSLRPGGAQIGVALGVATVYFMVFFRMTLPERSHLIEIRCGGCVCLRGASGTGGPGRASSYGSGTHGLAYRAGGSG